ncbi:MAG: hypothetical protein R2762_13510 [Bryobacteraceae bacterium]
MPGLPAIVAGAMLPLLAAFSIGRRCVPGDAVVQLAIGAAILSYGCFLILATGVSWLSAPVCAACLLLWRRTPLRWPHPTYLVCVPVGLYYLIHALAPEIQADAIGYHLGLVSGWLRKGDFLAQTGHYDLMPHGLEMLFTPAFAIGGHSAAKLVHFAFLVATIPMFASLGGALGLDRSVTLPASLIYVAAPVVGASGTCAYVDAALGFFSLAAFRLSLEDDDKLTGIAAGFCYAIKMTGGAMLLYLAVRRKWKAALVGGAVALPWMARAWWLSGNPFAPILNGVFPNPYLHIATERGLHEHIGSYGVAASSLWHEWTIGGGSTQGLTGPAFLLLPLGLLAMRHPAAKKLALAGAIAALPVGFNVGTRFLIPAMAFGAILITIAALATIGRAWGGRLAWAVALFQVAACAPGVLGQWSDPAAWRLHGFPWQAALRIEDEAVYLRHATEAFAVAEMIESHTKPGDKVLDVADLGRAYLDREAEPHWQYAGAERAADALHMAAHVTSRSAYRASASWSARAYGGIRIEQTTDGPEPWSFQEIELRRAGQAVFPSGSWNLTASTNPWELPLAFDRNPASRWQTWEPRRPGMWIQMDFPAPVELDGISILAPMGENGARYRVRGLAGREWVTLSDSQERRPWGAISLRGNAGRFLHREGFTHVAIRTHGDGFGKVGRDMELRPADWGMRLVGNRNGVYVYSHSIATTQDR